MKSYDADLANEVGELLELTVAEEATNAVWKTFERALGQLPEESRTLLENHLKGASTKKLSQQSGLTEEQVKNCLSQVKRQLQQLIRRDLRVRH